MKPAATREREKKPWAGRLAPVLLAGMIGLAYSNSLNGEFVMDDVGSIVTNPSIRRLWPPWTAMFPPIQGGRTVEGRPFLGLTLALNYAVGGLEPWSYHLFNVVVHVLATWTLFGLARRTLLLPEIDERLQSASTGLAFCIALAWGVHPLQTAAVTYVIQRAESLVGLFYLFTLYCVVRGEQSASRSRWHGLAVLCCAAGMLTKEVMATAPLLVLLYLRAFRFSTWKEVVSLRKPLLAGLASTWLLLALLIFHSGGRGGSVGFEQPVTSLQYLQTQCVAIPRYLRLAISPTPLVFDYGPRPITDARRVIPGALLLALLLTATLAAWRRWPRMAFLGSAFFLILAPSSSVVPIITQVIAEHRMYLPLAPVVALAVTALFLGWCNVLDRRRQAGHSVTHLRMLPIVAMALVAGLLAAQAWLRNLDYRTAAGLWNDTLAKWPLNERAHANLAKQHQLVGNVRAGIEQLNRAIEIMPQTPMLHYNRGTLLYLMRQDPAAIADFTTAIQLQPRYPEALLNRGVTYNRVGQHRAAVADFDESLLQSPGQALAYKNRAIAHLALKEWQHSAADLQQYLKHGGTPDREIEQLQRVLAEAP